MFIVYREVIYDYKYYFDFYLVLCGNIFIFGNNIYIIFL